MANKKQEEEFPNEDLVIVDLVDLITRTFKPAHSIAESDVNLTTKDLIKKIGGIIELSAEQQTQFFIYMKDSGFQIGILQGAGDFSLYWIFKNKN